MRFILCLLLFPVVLVACKTKEEVHQPASLVNTAHLDTLYDELVINGDSVGVIHIYSEYPDYHFVDDADEGFSCVDDVARAAIFYAREFNKTGNAEYERKMRMLTRFIFALHAPNGYFYNFVWPDGRINTDGITSKPTPDWWSWRALWAMGEVYRALSKRSNEPLLAEINHHRGILLKSVFSEPSFRSGKIDTIEGMMFPSWLPEKCAADESAILLSGLADAYVQVDESSGITKDSMAVLMRRLASGIMMMQLHQPDSAFDGAFLSWQNIWHAYGQAQAYALLKAGRALQDAAMLNAAIHEVKLYYPSLIASGGWEHYALKKNGDTLMRDDVKVFPQIAYGRRPAIWASAMAADITGQVAFLETAIQLGNWFFGENPAKQQMYDPMTGRGFDGINNATDINRNAGAESTIESLLAMQVLVAAGVQYDPEQQKLILPLPPKE